eukprot:TRINITY_DN127_c3_g2_i1.p2 TRINITY_DN127_c3_g2~~TRINITY_DN127_c3_g2_i1.p2  ORF type:complete len:611 (+),score=107.09 TRINITY_DN127_c3_g2_i1:406-2238(+)
MDAEIPRMLRERIIEEVPPEQVPHPRRAFATVFAVDKATPGEMRFILNCKKANLRLDCPKFRMNHLSSILPLLRRRDFVTSIDLCSAFSFVPLAPDSRPLLSFMYRGRVYQYRALPFGLNSAPRAFSKMLVPVLVRLRSMFPGIRVWAYIDDLLISARTRAESARATAALRRMLADLGFEVNVAKSEMTPSHVIKYLGFVLDTVSMTVSLPGKKRRDLRRSVSRWLAATEAGGPLPSIRALASLVGSLNSVRPAVPRALLFSGSLQSAKTAAKRSPRASWDSPSPPLSAGALRELAWWHELLSSPGPVRAPMTPRPATVILETDASGTGGGFCLRRAPPGATTSTIPQNRASLPVVWSSGWFWPRYILDASRSICDLELRATVWALRALGPRLRGQSVLLLSDNQATVSYATKGRGRVSLLRSLTKDLFEALDATGARQLEAAHLAGRLNTVADRESRAERDPTDWKLNPELFRRAVALWGAPQTDLFASAANAQVPRYFSLRLDPFAAGLDAFRHPWRGHLQYANPPFLGRIIARVLDKVIRERAKLILVLPVWPSAGWWPTFHQLCQDWFSVDAGTPGVFAAGHLASSVPGGPIRWPLRVALVSGARW